MTPKEKAEDLYENYYYTISYYSISDIPEKTIRQRTKDCALICVNEIIKTIPMTYYDYWQEVKQEIEKL